MDIFAFAKSATTIAESITDRIQGKPKSQFANGPVSAEGWSSAPRRITVADVLSFALGVVIGLYAAYLSWQCNSKLAYNTFLKVIFAVFAYLFGLVYLILYVVMRWDTCRKL